MSVFLTRRIVQRTQSLCRNVSSKTNNPFGKEYVNTPQSTNAPFGIARFAQANFFRSNAVFVAATLGVAVVASGAYESAFNTAWEWNNKGKLYKDIIGRYPNLPPNTEPEGGAPAEEEAEEETAAAEEAPAAAEE